MKPQRIVTFLPSATELIYSLGADDKLFGVTHECNYPSGAKTNRELSVLYLIQLQCQVNRLMTKSVNND